MSKKVLEPTVEQRELLDFHLRLVLEENKITNLTRITEWEQAQLLHIEDSLVGLPEFLRASEGNYVDIGTGAGFPGIPLAIMTGRTTLLADSVGKKTKALDKFISELGLAGQVSTYTGRIEDLSIQRRNEFSVVTARALSSLPSLLELTTPLLKVGGQLICYKARVDEDELDNAKRLKNNMGMRLVSKRECYLSDDETKRTIFVFEKFAEAKVKLPRRLGMAQKKPFIC